MERVALAVLLVLQLLIAHWVTPQQVQDDLLVVIDRLVVHFDRFRQVLQLVDVVQGVPDAAYRVMN